MSKRIEWIDIAKGLGIILVVVGHIVDYGKPLFIWIYSFHMALFFFISGMLFDPRKRINYKRLLKPGIITLCVSILITMMIPEWRAAVTLKGIIVSLYNGVFSLFHVNPIWFLFCLAWCETIMRLIFRYVPIERNWKWGVSVVSLLAFLAVFVKKGFHFASILTSVGLIFEPPMWVGTAILAMIFLFAGYIFRDYIKKLELFPISKLFAVAVSLFMCGGVAAYLNGNVNLGGFTFNNMGLYLLESVSLGGGSL